MVDAYEENDFVLCAEDGQIWKPEAFTALYFAFIRRIGRQLRFHELRHAHASQLMRARRQPEGGFETFRPQHGGDHTRPLLPRSARNAGGGHSED